MFNKDYKMSYLEENKDINLTLEQKMINEFNKIAPFEESLNKDLYDFSTSEIMEYYKFLSTPSLQYLTVLNGQLKIYTRKAIINNLVKDNQNHYEEFRPEILSKCVNKGLSDSSIMTREDVLRVCDSLDNPGEAFVILALFEGIRGKEFDDIIELYEENFDRESHKVRLHSGKELIVSTKLIDLAFESINNYEYICSSKNDKMAIKHFDEEDRRVVKRKKRDKRNDIATDEKERFNRSVSISKMLRKIREYTDINYIGSSISESGRIDMIKNIMKEKNIDLNTCISSYRNEIEYRYGRIQCLSTYVIKYGQFFEEE